MNSVDLFAGAGGWSHGWREATGCEPVVAVDHCAHAVHLHALNHPTTRHFQEDIWAVDPAVATAGRKIDWIHLSPSCTHFSRAKGDKPRSKQTRSQALVAIDWARELQPRFLSLENVPEFTTWGPLDEAGRPIAERAGEEFAAFVGDLRALGYDVEWRVLCAADYGAPTIRRRLFLVARNDGRPIRWPEPTHGDPAKQGLFTAGLRPWRTAAECIDWSLPCPSIFGRKRQLAEATCRRIAAGIVRFVLRAEPFLAVARGKLVAAFVAQHYGGQIGKPLSDPLPGGTLESGRAVAAFITSYYSQGVNASSIHQPLPTVVTQAHHGLVVLQVKDGPRLEFGDVGMRMLSPRELARAQGFPDNYILEGSKRDQTARIGNSVVPQVAAALVRANLGREAGGS